VLLLEETGFKIPCLDVIQAFWVTILRKGLEQNDAKRTVSLTVCDTAGESFVNRPSHQLVEDIELDCNHVMHYYNAEDWNQGAQSDAYAEELEGKTELDDDNLHKLLTESAGTDFLKEEFSPKVPGNCPDDVVLNLVEEPDSSKRNQPEGRLAVPILVIK
jgi:hypothetical protein